MGRAGQGVWGAAEPARRLLPVRETRTISRMRYEWDTAKGIENRRKHGIDFRDALPALTDPRRLEWIDDRFAYGEERTVTLGLSQGNVLFVVTTLWDEDTCRLISARRATRDEEDQYYTGVA